MSAALLQNNQHVHEILDDRESAFHLLTWSALRYTPHSSRDDVGPHMKPYDEMDVYCNGTVKGGTGKRDMIREPLRVTFYPPALHELIDGLRGWFCERYSILGRNALTSSENSDAESVKIFDAVEARYHRQCEKMRKRAALVRIFRRKLASGDWSEDCAAQENYTRKRKALDRPTDPCRSSKSRKGNPPTDSSRKSNGSSRK